VTGHAINPITPMNPTNPLRQGLVRRFKRLAQDIKRAVISF
jgi:hypothetical protein